jgi:hypothetical protein
MKCTCGVTKVYGAPERSPLHSDWCDASANAATRLANEQLAEAAEQLQILFTRTYGTASQPRCNWMHWGNAAAPFAVKIARATPQSNPIYTCQGCIDAANGFNLNPQLWDINDPSAPRPP